MDEYVSQMRTGNLLLVTCCIFYLIWWSVAFNPNKDFSMALKVILFICTLAPGVFGVLDMVQGMSGLPHTRDGISNTAIVIIGVICYFVLLLLTYMLMHRQVTTELVLIVGWTALEICAASSLYQAEALEMGAAIACVIITIVAAVIGMVCYLAYYNLEATIAFYDGMVPLILFGVAMAIETLAIW